MENKNAVYIFFAGLALIILAVVFNLISDYAATAIVGKTFRYLSTGSIIAGAGLFAYNFASSK